MASGQFRAVDGGTCMLEQSNRLAALTGQPADLTIRTIPGLDLDVVYIRTMVEPTRVEDRLIARLLDASETPGTTDGLLRWSQQRLWLGSIQATDSAHQACTALLEGQAVLCHRTAGYILVDVQGIEHRPPDEPATEAAIRGPRDGFSEALHTNLSLIRTRLRDRALRIEEMRVGTRTQTRIALLYLTGVAADDLVQNVRDRLEKIQADKVLLDGEIEQWLEDNPWSPYPQLQSTERPDKVAAALLEGRVAIVTDGTPFVLLAPGLMISFFQTTDDYSQRWLFGSFLRLIRSGALAASIFAPSFYIAMSQFNPELMPLKIALSLAASREGIPFPIVVEAFIMEAMVELLREAGNRLPKPLGSSLGVLGGLVIGDIAVKAGLVSPIMVIVVGLTALGSFAIPSYDAALTTRLLRFPLMLATSLFGLAGMAFFVLLIIGHLCSLSSFGVPYLTPFSQLAYSEWKDTFMRAPTRVLARRRTKSYVPQQRKSSRLKGGDE